MKLGGTVIGTHEKKGNKRSGGQYTLYSLRLDGEKRFINFGFEPHGFVEGDVIEVIGDAEGDNKFNVKKSRKTGHVEVAPKAAGGRGKAGGGSRDDYWAQKDAYDKQFIQPRIEFQSARKDALQFLAILAANDGLPITAAAGKANKAKRFEELEAVLNKLTVQFFNDTRSLRLIESVADAGDVEGSTPAALPSAAPAVAEETFEEEESFDDEETFDDEEDFDE